jgi:hypothetical protein
MTAGVIGLTAGCSRRAVAIRSQPEPSASASTQEVATPESALDALRTSSDTQACRSALKQLNSILGRRAEQRPAGLAEADRQFLQREFALDPEEMKEVGSTSFTLLDGHYLEECLLFRDITRALDIDNLSPLERATAAFSWVVREAPQKSQLEELVPPKAALHRIRATPSEQMAVFLALLRQLDVDGCVIALPRGEDAKTGLQPRLVGALIGDDIYLFDPILALPLPGPAGSAVATLGQARSQPNILESLNFDAGHRYDVTSERLKEAEIWASCPLSALAPRMSYLEKLFPPSSKTVLNTDAAALINKLRKASQPVAGTVRAWTVNAPDSPLTALRNFLPADEGGVDQRHRKAQFEYNLVPWEYLPDMIKDMPANTDPGRTLRKGFEQKFLNLLIAPNMPRDQMLRGRCEDASRTLVSMREELIQLSQIFHDQQDVVQVFRNWCKESERVYGELARASRNPSDVAGLESARARVRQLWKDGEQVLPLALTGRVSGPLIRLTTYLLALTKQEQAEALQRQLDHQGQQASQESVQACRQAWQVAADWWETYLTENATAPKLPSARLCRARALAALNQRQAAATLLSDFSDLSKPEELGHLLRIRQLGQ